MLFSSFNILDNSRPIVVFGRDGQVGKALQTCIKGFKMPSVFLDRADCDLSNELSIIQVLNQYQPQVIINAAAYTAVNQAESEPELAFAINARAPELMARYMVNVPHGILLHYSTDYVFADTKADAYLESDVTGPVDLLTVYGQSKLAGEQAIEEVFTLAQDFGHISYQDKLSRYFILRASWVYGDGHNFMRTMLRLAIEHDHLKVISDQVGVPTSAQWLAEISLQMLGSRAKSGIYHAVPDGEISWHGLAVFAIEIAASLDNGIKVKSKNICPIPAIDYSLLAKRPYNSRMNNQKLKKALFRKFPGEYPHWQEQVETYVKKYVANFL